MTCFRVVLSVLVKKACFLLIILFIFGCAVIVAVQTFSLVTVCGLLIAVTSLIERRL